MTGGDDPVLVHSRREGLIIMAVWLASTIYCCAYSYLHGYIREGHMLGAEDVRPVLGMPHWFFWGVFLPWVACAAFTFVFAGFFMADDDLGADEAFHPVSAPGQGVERG